MSLRVLTYVDVLKIANQVGLFKFTDELILRVEEAFKNWHSFKMVPRVSFHYSHGVMEAMPISDDKYYTVKIVNGHPGNPSKNLLTVVAVGLLADVETGYPLMFCDATLLTAFRTAATSAVATKYLARPNSKSLGIIGTGSQAEFQCVAISRVIPINEVVFYDVDQLAMDKFEKNVQHTGLEIHRASSARMVASLADILITATAVRGKHKVVSREDIKPGTHINAIGGDAPGKTELDPRILFDAKVVVEYMEQAITEGEVQNITADKVYAELWEIVTGVKNGRINEQEITVFDSVGIALEDWAALTYIYEKAQELDSGTNVRLLPKVLNPKDLFSLLSSSTNVGW
ncbi:MAG: ornithine cyclodeaminase [Thermofilaceae archaeon]